VEVARLGSFTKAAEQLLRTQPAVSVQVRKLEEELGSPLFDRAKRKPVLTEGGKVLLVSATELLEKIDGLKNLVDGSAESPTGTLTIASNASLITVFLPEVLRDFHRRYPGVRFRLLNLTAKGIARAIEEGEADIGLGFLVEGHPYISACTLQRSHFALVCRKDSALAGKKRLTLNGILTGRLLHFEEGVDLRIRLERGLEGRTSLDPVLELPTMESILRYVYEGFGYSILPEYALSADWRIKLVVKLLTRWIEPLEICTYSHRRRIPSTAATHLRENLSSNTP
jgi:DNA-binding transcriptional LysR family regulator